MTTFLSSTLRRASVLALLAASFIQAEPAYVTLHGKTYHTNRQCSTLARSRAVYQTEDSIAKAHGRHECAACARKRTGVTKSGKDAGLDWAKLVEQAAATK